jgi:23S rRNA (cytosine1962-C5)-methyltransferase
MMQRHRTAGRSDAHALLAGNRYDTALIHNGAEPMPVLVLKADRVKPALRRHPWVFSGAVARVEGDPAPGETVLVRSDEGRELGVAAYSPQSQIRARMWSFDGRALVDEAFLRARLAAAIEARGEMLARVPGGCGRLVNAESDGLPGLIVDRYADFLVCQFQSAGVERWKAVIVEQLQTLWPCLGIYERSEAESRRKEGLGPAEGRLAGEEPPELVEILEGPYRYLVDIRSGHKTGFYLDQRVNRVRVANYAAGREMLNCFAYTGGFTVPAMQAGAASVTNVETSAPALALGRLNLGLNGLEAAAVQDVEGDVFKVLRSLRDGRRNFDLIVLDPPKFADARAHVGKAARGYKDINLLAFKLLRPGGLLFTFSCSGLIGRDLFQKIVADAAVDATRDVQILEWLSQAPDHPVALGFPEGAYLKGLVCRVS